MSTDRFYIGSLAVGDLLFFIRCSELCCSKFLMQNHNYDFVIKEVNPGDWAIYLGSVKSIHDPTLHHIRFLTKYGIFYSYEYHLKYRLNEEFYR